MPLIAPDGYFPDSPQESSVAARPYPCLPTANQLCSLGVHSSRDRWYGP